MKLYLSVILLLLASCAANKQTINFSGHTDIAGDVPIEVQTKKVTTHCYGRGLDERCVTITHDPINTSFEPTPR
jgi:hypothetical protein